MNLTELQQELRKIETQLATLNQEIESMKPKKVEESEEEYERINRIARKNPIKIEELTKASDFQKNLYLKVLSYLIQVDCSEKIPAIQFLTRIGAGINAEKFTSQYVMQLGLQVTIADLESVIKELDFIKDYLLVDALMLMNMGKGFTDSGSAIIADWLKAWDYSKVDREAIAQITRAFLTQNLSLLNHIQIVDDKRWQGKFWHYIPYHWIKDNRVYYNRPTMNMEVVDEKSLKRGIVKKEDCIAIVNSMSAGTIVGLFPKIQGKRILALKNGLSIIPKKGISMSEKYYICITSYFDKEDLVFVEK